MIQDIESDYRLTHRMAHEMPEYLVPPPRAAILVRAHTDPDTYDPGSSSSSRTAPPMAPPPSPNFRPIPSSPPPAYTDVVGEVSPRKTLIIKAERAIAGEAFGSLEWWNIVGGLS